MRKFSEQVASLGETYSELNFNWFKFDEDFLFYLVMDLPEIVQKARFAEMNEVLSWFDSLKEDDEFALDLKKSLIQYQNEQNDEEKQKVLYYANKVYSRWYPLCAQQIGNKYTYPTKSEMTVKILAYCFRDEFIDKDKFTHLENVELMFINKAYDDFDDVCIVSELFDFL